MNDRNVTKQAQVMVALGKSVVYLLLFLGCQTVVSLAYVAVGARSAVGSGGLDMDLLIEYIYQKSSAMTLISGLATLAVLVLFNLIRREKLSETLTLRRVSADRLVSAAAMTPALYLVVIIVLALLPEQWMTGYIEASSALTNTGLVAFFSTVVVAPLVEEIIFRGLIQSRLSRAVPGWLAVLLAAAIFGICHGEPVWMAYAFFLGAVFGFVAWRSGSILPTVVMHVVFNALGHFSTVLTEAGVGDQAFLAGVLVLSIGGTVFARKGIGRLLRGEEMAPVEQTKEEDGP